MNGVRLMSLALASFTGFSSLFVKADVPVVKVYDSLSQSARNDPGQPLGAAILTARHFTLAAVQARTIKIDCALIIMAVSDRAILPPSSL